MSDGIQLIEPPHSNEAEQSLLGAILVDNNAWDRVVDVVSSDDFYLDAHRRIWRHISRLIEAARPADVVTVSEAINTSEDKDKTGGPSYLAGLSQNTPSARNARRYAELVRARSLQRKLMQVGSEICEAALRPGSREIGQILDEAEGKVFALSERQNSSGEGPKEIGGLLSRVYERIDHLHNQDNPSDVTGVPSGFVDLDHMTSGFQPTDLIIIGGRPSMGKTALALNIIEHVAVKERLPVVLFSMEMSGAQVTQRLLSSIGKVDAHKLRTGRLADDEWASLTDAMSILHEAPIHIDQGGALTAMEVRARARRVKREYSKLGLVVVDYLQLMESRSQGEQRAQEVSEITRSLKSLAKELEVPVIALSQLSREVDKRTNHRPVLSDLRESGSIEQDADMILFIHREEFYSPEAEDWKGIADVIVGKQRNGPVGDVRLAFLGRYTRFANYTNPGFGEPRRPQKAKVRNFNDYKAAAAGPDS